MSELLSLRFSYPALVVAHFERLDLAESYHAWQGGG